METQDSLAVRSSSTHTEERVRTVVEPTFRENLNFFFSYQLNYMYWRYFLWNFVGRQSDIQALHETILDGNWRSGINAIDELYIGPQEEEFLPREVKENRGRNAYYFLPFLLGLVGLLYQLNRDQRNFTVVMWLFLMMGIVLVLYFNTSPNEPRERDYIYAGSFYAFSIWIGLGVLMHRPVLAALLVAYETLMGVAAAVGGRRSEVGQQYVAQIRGLRSHLTRASVFDMQQCLEKNPAYFFELMPYALALGVERPFARRFGKVTVAECSYLIAPVRGDLTPLQWAGLLRQVADRLNRRQRRLKYEQLFNTAEHLVKSK